MDTTKDTGVVDALVRSMAERLAAEVASFRTALEGLTAAELTKRLGLGLGGNGLAPTAPVDLASAAPKGRVDDVLRAKVRTLREQGLSYQAIAETDGVGVSVGTVRRVLAATVVAQPVKPKSGRRKKVA